MKVCHVSDVSMEAAFRMLGSGGLATTFRSIPFEEASTVLRARYGIAGTFKRLDTEKDDTFLVSLDDDGKAIVKFSNPAENTDEVSLQLAALGHVASADPALPVPRVVPTREGEAFFSHTDDAGQSRLVRMLTFIDGTPLDSFDSTVHEREKVGEVLARLRLAMAGFAHPHDGREIAWDIKNLPKLAPLIALARDPAQRRALERGMQRFIDLHGRLQDCRMQVLHNDFSRSNIVIDRSRADPVSGVIDFGDVVRTHIAIDVSTALLNQLRSIGDEAMFDHGRDVLRGYLRVGDLTEPELLLLPHLVMGRVIARALITTWRAEQFPDNEPYIMRNTHQGWSQLDYFLSRSVAEISAMFSEHLAPNGAAREKVTS